MAGLEVVVKGLLDPFMAFEDKIESAREEWNNHMVSCHPKDEEFFMDDASKLFQNRNEDSIASRLTAIHNKATYLQERLKQLSSRSYTIPSHLDLSSTTELLERHLPTEPIGPETTNSRVCRWLKAVEISLFETHDFAWTTEYHVCHRFYVMHKTVKITIYHLSGTNLLSMLAEVAIKKAFYEGGSFEDSSDGLERAGCIATEIVEPFEKLALLLKKCLHSFGINMPRQRLLTEFTDGPGTDALSLATAILPNVVNTLKREGEALIKLSLSLNDLSNQRRITDFFGRVERISQTSNMKTAIVDSENMRKGAYQNQSEHPSKQMLITAFLQKPNSIDEKDSVDESGT